MDLLKEYLAPADIFNHGEASLKQRLFNGDVPPQFIAAPACNVNHLLVYIMLGTNPTCQHTNQVTYL